MRHGTTLGLQTSRSVRTRPAESVRAHERTLLKLADMMSPEAQAVLARLDQELDYEAMKNLAADIGRSAAFASMEVVGRELQDRLQDEGTPLDTEEQVIQAGMDLANS